MLFLHSDLCSLFVFYMFLYILYSLKRVNFQHDLIIKLFSLSQCRICLDINYHICCHMYYEVHKKVVLKKIFFFHDIDCFHGMPSIVYHFFSLIEYGNLIIITCPGILKLLEYNILCIR